MKMALVTAAAFPSADEATRKLWIFLESCRKADVMPRLYGVGTPQFPGYRQMMLEMQLGFLKTLKGQYTHICFSDGWDAFLCAPFGEIVEKYRAMGSPPILAAAFFQLGNVSDEQLQYPNCFDHSIYYRYPNRGGYVAEYGAIVEAFARMLKLPRQTGDECFNWYDAWQEGWFRPVLDSKCEIFQVTDNHATVGSDGRLCNDVTGSRPCILHLAGGYCDPETGKDHVLEPWARRLGVIQ